jgi:hypothetical protein
MMLRWKCLLILTSGWLQLTAAAQAPSEPAAPAMPPSLLGDAFNKLMANQGHWAYTQTQTVTGLTVGLQRATVFQVDPSRTYAEQFVPVAIEGKPPTSGDRQEFRGIGERVAKRRLRDEQDSKEHSGDELHLSLNFQVVTPDLAHATVLSEDEKSVTYEVPLRTRAGASSEAFDTFQVTARVSKQRREFEHATFRQRAAMRVDLLAKVSDAQIDCEFTSVDGRFPAVITRETQQATVRLLFMKRLLKYEMSRGDFRRVTPFDERFGVKLGPIRTIQF